MANVEHTRGYVGPQPYDPKKETYVDPKKFQEEINKKVQASGESEKRDERKKKNLEKSDDDDDEKNIAAAPPPPQVEAAFSEYMTDDDPGPSLLEGVGSKAKVGLGSPPPPPSSEPDEDLSHVQEDIIPTEEREYEPAPPPPQTPTAPPPPPPQAAPPPPPAQPPPEEVAPSSPQQEELVPNLEEQPSSQPVATPAQKSPKKKATAPDHSLFGKAAPKRKGLREKRFEKKLAAAKAAKAAKREAEPKAPSTTPSKEEAKPPSPAVPTPEKTTSQEPTSEHKPLAPSHTPEGVPISPGKLHDEKKEQKISRTPGHPVEASDKGGVIPPVQQASEKEKSKEHKKGHEEAAIEAISALPPGAVPLAGHLPQVEETPPSPYASLPPQVREIFDKMVGMITIQVQTGVTTTSVTVDMPGIFKGARIILEEYDTARQSFNIQLEGTPEQLNLFNANMTDLVAAFEAGKYSFQVNLLKPQLLSSRDPHLIKKVAGSKDKDSSGDKQ